MSAGELVQPPVGIVGEFVDLALDCSRRTWVMHVELPFDAWDPVTKGIGMPSAPEHRDDPARARPVAILSCRAPMHPAREGDVLAEACLVQLRQLLDAGRLNPVRAETIDRLQDVLSALALAVGMTPAAPQTEG